MEIAVILKTLGGSASCEKLHKMLPASSRLRVVTHRSLAHFIKSNKAFRVENGAVRLNETGASSKVSALPADSLVLKVICQQSQWDLIAPSFNSTVN
jgi:hypothetical protein